MENPQDQLNQTLDPLNEIAEKYFGIKYLFPYQRLVISNIIEITSGNNPDFPSGQIVILPTGAGKSLCFMLPALLLKKPTLIIFPLLSLMADQKRRLDEAGLETAVLKGGQDKITRMNIFKGIENERYKVILTNPETLNTESVLNLLKGNNGEGKIAHVVIDEAHTVSEWGDTFRKSYLEIGKLIDELKPDAVTAFTATASEKILERLTSIIFNGKNINMISANPDRTNIKYSVVKTISREHDLIRLAEKCKKPAVIFCSSRVSAELTASLLIKNSSFKEVKFYHAGLEASEKKDVENWFFTSSVGVLTSTCAYGLGVDKSNIRTVIHRELPGSVESYLQESGRGGRDRNQAYAIALFSESDRKRIEIFDSDIQKTRYKNLLEFADSKKTCRRKILLKSLSAETDYCEGCDICDKSFRVEPEGKKEIIELIRKNNKMLTLSEASEILKGTNNARRRTDFIWQSSSFGALSEWSSDSIKKGIICMISSGEMRQGRFLRKNLLILLKHANIKS